MRRSDRTGRGGTRGRDPARRCCPRLEGLEDRITPATYNVTDLASLRAAVAAVSHATGPNTINLAPGTYDVQSDQQSEQGELSVTQASNLTIQGASANDVTIENSEHISRIFEFDHSSVTLSGVRIIGGDAHYSKFGSKFGGGGIFANASTLTVDNAVLAGNHADRSGEGGGGIMALSSTLTVDNSVLASNSADGCDDGGGGITALSSTLTVDHTELIDNHADGCDFGEAGGGIFADDSRVTVDNSVLTSNSADNCRGGGGGIAAVNSTLTVDRTELTGNHANNSMFRGGGIFADGSTLTVDHTELTGNYANPNNSYGWHGGGILIVENRPAEIDYSTISGNSPNDLAFADGGAAHLKQTVVGATRYHDATLP